MYLKNTCVTFVCVHDHVCMQTQIGERLYEGCKHSRAWMLTLDLQESSYVCACMYVHVCVDGVCT